jgi:hypothetical protein
LHSLLHAGLARRTDKSIWRSLRAGRKQMATTGLLSFADPSLAG